MRSITDSYPLRCTPEVFWRVFMDAAYARALYTDALGFRSFQILEHDEASRKTLCVPKMNLPGPIAKLVGDTFAYEEHGALDGSKSEWTWRMLQPAGPDGKRKPSTIATRGTMRIVAEGEGNCLRTDEIIVEAKVFGLGGMIENTIEKEIRSGWTKERAFLERWLERPADKVK